MKGLELVVVSPLSRALETAVIAFAPFVPRSPIPPDVDAADTSPLFTHSSSSHIPVPFIAREEIREQIGQNVCDRRRPVREISTDFPAVDFSCIRDEDELWTEEREPKSAVADRAGEGVARFPRHIHTYIHTYIHT